MPPAALKSNLATTLRVLFLYMLALDCKQNYIFVGLVARLRA